MLIAVVSAQHIYRDSLEYLLNKRNFFLLPCRILSLSLSFLNISTVFRHLNILWLLTFMIYFAQKNDFYDTWKLILVIWPFDWQTLFVP